MKQIRTLSGEISEKTQRMRVLLSATEQNSNPSEPDSPISGKLRYDIYRRNTLKLFLPVSNIFTGTTSKLNSARAPAPEFAEK